jgi:hypothetical protein
MSTDQEFKSLVRRTTAGPTGAPWWVRLLFHTIVAIAVILGLAAAVDALGAYLFDREPTAVCAILGLFPWGVFLSAGLLCVMGGLFGLFIGAKAAGLRWLLIGALLYGAPQVYVSLGPVAACYGLERPAPPAS